MHFHFHFDFGFDLEARSSLANGEKAHEIEARRRKSRAKRPGNARTRLRKPRTRFVQQSTKLELQFAILFLTFFAAQSQPA